MTPTDSKISPCTSIADMARQIFQILSNDSAGTPSNGGDAPEKVNPRANTRVHRVSRQYSLSANTLLTLERDTQPRLPQRARPRPRPSKSHKTNLSRSSIPTRTRRNPLRKSSTTAEPLLDKDTLINTDNNLKSDTASPNQINAHHDIDEEAEDETVIHETESTTVAPSDRSTENFVHNENTTTIDGLNDQDIDMSAQTLRVCDLFTFASKETDAQQTVPPLYRHAAAQIVQNLTESDGTRWTVHRVQRLEEEYRERFDESMRKKQPVRNILGPFPWADQGERKRGWTFTYVCDQRQCLWDQLGPKQQQWKSVRSTVCEATSRGPSTTARARPAFDCEGVLRISFLDLEQWISVSYTHMPMHATLGDLIDQFAAASLETSKPNLLVNATASSTSTSAVGSPTTAVKRKQAFSDATQGKKRKSVAGSVAVRTARPSIQDLKEPIFQKVIENTASPTPNEKPIRFGGFQVDPATGEKRKFTRGRCKRCRFLNVSQCDLKKPSCNVCLKQGYVCEWALERRYQRQGHTSSRSQRRNREKPASGELTGSKRARMRAKKHAKILSSYADSYDMDQTHGQAEEKEMTSANSGEDVNVDSRIADARDANMDMDIAIGNFDVNLDMDGHMAVHAIDPAIDHSLQVADGVSVDGQYTDDHNMRSQYDQSQYDQSQYDQSQYDQSRYDGLDGEYELGNEDGQYVEDATFLAMQALQSPHLAAFLQS